MTQPNDPTEALPARRQPDDGAATVRLNVHPPQPQAEPTAHLPSRDATVHLAGGQPTARLASDEATVRLAAGEPTASLAHGAATVRPDLGEATMPQRALGGPPGPWPAARHAPGEWTARATATEVGHVAGAGRTTAPGPGTPPGGPAAAPGGEVRFGPGVPTTPPPAPAWPAPPRRRSAWRTVASVLSTLLTVALLAAVGLYLWQRISPLEVTGVTVAVPQPAGDRCDVTVDVVATVSTNGRAGEIRYQWLRTGSAPGSLLTERVGYGQRTVELTLRWTFSGVGSTTETATVNITSPAPVQAQTPVSYGCRRR
ncbi:hypothetical protein RM555_22045 [Micromonospora sp. DSM 115977]|uniref:Ig-like domain-containing protein n=1 Tax=Micromonospora reichwaldensis TaxID=3075516 RepID=A0ABU2X0G5_9ACTN|nr:hypothetical protein [Micromonospora sp. DSM 115977]MDT0531675.1 hypothetical protein [Micromonospora sp. DSM 115977]